jgi:hypothetical protein
LLKGYCPVDACAGLTAKGGRPLGTKPGRRSKRAAPTAPDPITREIIKGALRSAQAEMEAVIERTSMSPFIREKKD